MPSKKLIDILDEMNFKENEVLNKLGRLLRLIESYNPSIDDPELRWVEHKIEQMEDGYTPTKNNLLTAPVDIDYLETLYREKFMVGKKSEKIFIKE